jgi:hypothetical protein
MSEIISKIILIKYLVGLNTEMYCSILYHISKNVIGSRLGEITNVGSYLEYMIIYISANLINSIMF